MLAPWKESYDKPRLCIKKQRQVPIVKAMIFPVVMFRCESWTIKKAEHRRTDAFKLQYWTRLLIVTERRSNQSILKDINPEYSLEGLMLKLKLQYSGHLMQRADSLEKTLMMGKIDGRREVDNRGRDDRMASPTQWACLSKLWEMVKDRETCHSWGHKESDMT